MNIYQLKELISPNADSGSFLFSVIIAVLFYFKYKQLEAETIQEDMLENFLK